MQQSEYKKLIFSSPVATQLLRRGLERLPHALLLLGPAGVGKAAFAEQLAALMLCEAATPGLVACGKCQACRWLDAGNHPDFRRVAPDGDEGGEDSATDGAAEKGKKRASRIIRIDQIRELESFVFVGSHRDGRRVVVIPEAEAMNQAAANALLKILEEPPSSVYFILIATKQKYLLPTIRSRCRALAFGPPEIAAATAWLSAIGLEKQGARYLALAGGAPLRVAQWKEQGQLPAIDGLIDSLLAAPPDPIALAARWDTLLKTNELFRMENLVEGVQRWLFDLAQERVAGELRYHKPWSRPKGIENLNPVLLLGAWRDLNQFRRSARHPLNQLLFLENMATHFLRALRPVTP